MQWEIQNNRFWEFLQMLRNSNFSFPNSKTNTCEEFGNTTFGLVRSRNSQCSNFQKWRAYEIYLSHSVRPLNLLFPLPGTFFLNITLAHSAHRQEQVSLIKNGLENILGEHMDRQWTVNFSAIHSLSLLSVIVRVSWE